MVKSNQLNQSLTIENCKLKPRLQFFRGTFSWKPKFWLTPLVISKLTEFFTPWSHWWVPWQHEGNPKSMSIDNKHSYISPGAEILLGESVTIVVTDWRPAYSRGTKVGGKALKQTCRGARAFGAIGLGAWASASPPIWRCRQTRSRSWRNIMIHRCPSKRTSMPTLCPNRGSPCATLCLIPGLSGDPNFLTSPRYSSHCQNLNPADNLVILINLHNSKSSGMPLMVWLITFLLSRFMYCSYAPPLQRRWSDEE